MSTSLGTLFYELGIETKDFIAKLKDSETKAADLDKALTKVADTCKDVGDKMTKNLTLPIIALGTAAVVMAADAENSANRFNKVFTGSIVEANKEIENLVANYGMSTFEAQKMTAATGTLLKSMGATTSEAASMSGQLAVLAVDLAASSGGTFTAEEASYALTKAMTGQTKGLKDLGISLNAADVEQAMLISGNIDLENGTVKLATATEILRLVTDKTSESQGAFAANAGSLSQKIDETGDSVSELLVSFGTALLPMVKDITDGLKSSIDSFNRMSDSGKETVITILALTAAIGPMILGVGKTVEAIGLLNKSAALLGMTGGSLALVTSGILAIVAATAILAKNVNDKQMKELEEAFVNVAAAAGVAGSSIRKIETAGLQIYSPFVKTEKIVKELAEELGLTETQVLSIALASEEVQKGHAKTLETMNLMLDAQVEQTRSYRAYAEYAAARAASAEAEIKRLAAVQEAADKKVAAAKEALEKSYVDARKNVLDILASEQSEYDKILAQIKVLQATPWAKGKLEDDRLAAIEVLKKNILDLQKTEMEGAVANIKAYANESRESRKTVEATLAEYQNYYAEIAASQLKKLKDLQTERDNAIKLAESTGANKQSILDDYAAQEKKLKDEMAAAEKARIAAIKSASDAYYAQLLAQNQAKLVAIQTESRLAIEAATKQGLSTVALKAGYAAQEEAINQAMQAAEKARVAEMTTIDAAYYSYLANLTGDRLLQLENEKNQAIADAQAAGMAIDTIITAYAAKEVALKETMAAEEKAREQAKLDAKLQFEQTYIDKIRVDSSTKLELIQFEKEAAIKAAEEAGADISAIEEYYALKEAEQIAADAKEATDKKIAETQRYAGYTTSALSAIGDLVDTLSANELAAIDAQTAATIAGYDAEIVALQATYDAEQLIRDQKAIDDQAALDKEKADLDELETMRESMRGNVLQGLYDEQEELLRKEELGVVLTDAEKARIADIQNMIAGGGQAELDALKAKQAAGATLSQVELTRVSELEAAINGAKNSQLTGIDALIAAKKNAANLALSEVEANKAAQKAADAALKESNKTLENQKIKANYDAEVSKHKIAVDSFNANKALASASAAVALGLAIMQGYAQLGPIAGSVAALVLAGIGIAQQAAIWLPAPPPAPPAPVYLASGGYIPKTFGGVSTVLGEGNSAEVVLPLTDKVFRKLGDSIVNNLLGSTKQTQQSTPINQVIQVIMDGKVLYNVVNTGLTNRSIRVPSAALV